MKYLALILLNFGIMMLTAWTFHMTGNPWSFAILVFLFTSKGCD